MDGLSTSDYGKLKTRPGEEEESLFKADAVNEEEEEEKEEEKEEGFFNANEVNGEKDSERDRATPA